MIRVLVSEKGGPEQELLFDTNEVSIGRAPGNLLVLSKQNVSKRHATIMFRDGKVVLVDLKSTNGTYINGRRLTSPKEVTPEDRIYIGDFTIKVSLLDEKDIKRQARDTGEQRIPPVSHTISEIQKKPTLVMPSLPSSGGSESDGTKKIAPLELDVEVVSDIISEIVPPPPPVLDVEDSGPMPIEAASEEVIPSKSTVAKEVEPKVDIEKPQTLKEVSSYSDVDVTKRVQSQPKLLHVIQENLIDQSAFLSSVAQRVLEEVFKDIEPSRTDFSDQEWSRLSESVMRIVEKMKVEGIVPNSKDTFTLTQDILFEFTGLGPLEELLSDESVRTVIVEGVDRIFVSRGEKPVRWQKRFSSEVTLERVVAKLFALAGIEKLGHYVEGRLPDNTLMQVIAPPLSINGHVVILERPTFASITPEELISEGVLSEKQISVLREILMGHRNVIVVGPSWSGRHRILSALLKLNPECERIIVLCSKSMSPIEGEKLVFIDRDALMQEHVPCSTVITRLKPDMVVVPDIEPEDFPLLSRIALCGQKGLVMSAMGDSVYECFNHISTMMAISYPTVSNDTLQALLKMTFDVFMMLGQAEDGKIRVSGIYMLGKDGDFSLMVY